MWTHTHTLNVRMSYYRTQPLCFTGACLGNKNKIETAICVLASAYIRRAPLRSTETLSGAGVPDAGALGAGVPDAGVLRCRGAGVPRCQGAGSWEGCALYETRVRGHHQEPGVR